MKTENHKPKKQAAVKEATSPPPKGVVSQPSTALVVSTEKRHSMALQLAKLFRAKYKKYRYRFDVATGKKVVLMTPSSKWATGHTNTTFTADPIIGQFHKRPYVSL